MFGILILSFDRCHQTVWLKDQWTIWKVSNGFVDNLSHHTIAKEGRKEEQAYLKDIRSESCLDSTEDLIINIVR